MYEVLTNEALYNENERLKDEINKLENENAMLYESLSNMSELVEDLLDSEEEKFFQALKE